MLYKKRVERALDHLAAKRGRKRKDPDRDKYAPLRGQEYDPRAEQEPDDISHMLERGDLAAMLISAFIVPETSLPQTTTIRHRFRIRWDIFVLSSASSATPSSKNGAKAYCGQSGT